jgi:hypothetical protein
MALKIGRLRPGLNPRAWVPDASMLTTRTPKPLGIFTCILLKIVHVSYMRVFYLLQQYTSAAFLQQRPTVAHAGALHICPFAV